MSWDTHFLNWLVVKSNNENTSDQKESIISRKDAIAELMERGTEKIRKKDH